MSPRRSWEASSCCPASSRASARRSSSSSSTSRSRAWPEHRGRPLPTSRQRPAGLTWGVKHSFLRYLAALPDGGHAVSGGAYVGDENFFTGPPARACRQMVDRELRFRGSLQLSGHAGLLQVHISDPYVVLKESGALLTIANRIDYPDGSARIPLAELDIDDAYRTHRGVVLPLIAASLTTAGCALVGEHYPAGEPLDPVFVFAPHPGSEPPRQ